MAGKRNEAARERRRHWLKDQLSLTSVPMSDNSSLAGESVPEKFTLGNHFGWKIIRKTQMGDGKYPHLATFYEKPNLSGKDFDKVTYVLYGKEKPGKTEVKEAPSTELKEVHPKETQAKETQTRFSKEILHDDKEDKERQVTIIEEPKWERETKREYKREEPKRVEQKREDPKKEWIEMTKEETPVKEKVKVERRKSDTKIPREKKLISEFYYVRRDRSKSPKEAKSKDDLLGGDSVEVGPRHTKEDKVEVRPQEHKDVESTQSFQSLPKSKDYLAEVVDVEVTRVRKDKYVNNVEGDSWDKMKDEIMEEKEMAREEILRDILKRRDNVKDKDYLAEVVDVKVTKVRKDKYVTNVEGDSWGEIKDEISEEKEMAREEILREIWKRKATPQPQPKKIDEYQKSDKGKTSEKNKKDDIEKKKDNKDKKKDEKDKKKGDKDKEKKRRTGPKAKWQLQAGADIVSDETRMKYEENIGEKIADSKLADKLKLFCKGKPQKL